MKAVLGKDKKPKKGDVVQFGTYDDQPIKWKVLETDARSHKALLIADSYCGKAKNDPNMNSVVAQIDKFTDEWFSVDEQKLICAIGLLTNDDISKYSFSENDLKFYPYGTDKKAEAYWYYHNDRPTHLQAYFVRADGSLVDINDRLVLSIRPVMWIKYDCVPAEKSTGEEQK